MAEIQLKIEMFLLQVEISLQLHLLIIQTVIQLREPIVWGKNYKQAIINGLIRFLDQEIIQF